MTLSDDVLKKCNDMICAYAVKCLRKCKRSAIIDFDELVAEGMYALANSLAKFNENAGTDFVAYFSRALANRFGHVTYWSYKKELYITNCDGDEEEDSHNILEESSSCGNKYAPLTRAVDTLLRELTLEEKDYVRELLSPADDEEDAERYNENKSARFKVVREKLGIGYGDELRMRKHVAEVLFA